MGAHARASAAVQQGNTPGAGRHPGRDFATTRHEGNASSAQRRAEQLVNTYADLILRLSYTYLHSTHDAEDICQEVLLKVINRQRGFESAEHERAWVVRVTANTCRDLLRRQKAHGVVALDEVAEPMTTRVCSATQIEERRAACSPP